MASPKEPRRLTEPQKAAAEAFRQARKEFVVTLSREAFAANNEAYGNLWVVANGQEMVVRAMLRYAGHLHRSLW